MPVRAVPIGGAAVTAEHLGAWVVFGLWALGEGAAWWTQWRRSAGEIR